MADSKISALPDGSTPLAGTELVPIDQGGDTVKVPASAFGGGTTVTVTELEFNAPDTAPSNGWKDGTWVNGIVDPAISPTSKIVMWNSGNPATGRHGADLLWDTITWAAVAKSGAADVYAWASGRIIGGRKVYYSVF